MEWVLRLEAKSGWGEVETIEVAGFVSSTLPDGTIVQEERALRTLIAARADPR